MKVLMVGAEVAPLAKVGGLADVMAALPPALADLGVEVAVAMPCYRGVREQVDVRPAATIVVPVGEQEISCTVLETRLPGSEVPLYLLSNDPYFDRPQIYGEGGGDYPDSLERFTFLSRGALAVPEAVGWIPQVIHAHDWHTALIPLFVRAGAGPSGVRSMLTIHNLAHQGTFSLEQEGVTGLPGELREYIKQEDQLNLLQGGIKGSDMITTVSPTYAREILEQEGRLKEALRARAQDLFGVLNGIDQHTWDPEADPYLWEPYSADDLSGKAVNKASLQRVMGLEDDPRRPVVGMVTRLAEQKGLDLVLEELDRLMGLGIQLVVLGTGEPRYEQGLQEAQARFPGQIAVFIGFSEPLAHRVEAGSDMFLMPSRFEPCGLNQLYSLRYGTVPVVRATGGLADTVREGQAGNGFTFAEYRAEALAAALERAVEVYRSEQPRWNDIVQQGMRGDYSWRRSAEAYLKLYRRLARES